MDPRALHRLAPEACPGCGGVEFEPTVTGHLDGSRGPGMSWLVCCRGCGAAWMALSLLEAVLGGQPPEWFRVEAERYAAARPRPEPPPLFRCPGCQRGLSFGQQSECPHCGWLRHPAGARQDWGRAGGCPGCGFAYRWDGTRCSHCGHTGQAEPHAPADRGGNSDS